MTHDESDALLALFMADPTTRMTCATRYDEVVLAAQLATECLATVVFKARKSDTVRVVQLVLADGRWTVASENTVSTAPDDRRAPTRLVYPARKFHFVPGTGESPDWIEAERPTDGRT